jgi:putative transposase
LKRTVKLFSEKLNNEKWRRLKEITELYGSDKDFFLKEITNIRSLSVLKSPNSYRNSLMVDAKKNGTSPSPNGLPARYWKMTLTDAVNTYKTYWAVGFEKVKDNVFRHSDLTKEQKRFIFWTLKDIERVKQVLECYYHPVLPTHFDISEEDAVQASKYLQRTLQRKLGSRPRVKRNRSFTLDSDMYGVFEHKGKLYLNVQSLVTRKRIPVPLKGKHKITGNLRIVLDKDSRTLEVHITKDLKARFKPSDNIEAIDLGISECFTDSDSTHYKEETGALIYSYSDKICDKGKKRNRLWNVHDKHMVKYEELKDKDPKSARYHLKKAVNLKENNLGYRKLNDTRRKQRANYERLFNEACNDLIRNKQPKVVVMESLDFRGKAKSRRMSRAVSNWMRSTAKERLPFKLEEAGCLLERVTPSYSSQRCPNCDFVYRRNRGGDVFKCRFCGYGGDVDGVSPRNLLDYYCFGLHRYMRKEEVKRFILANFQRRLESWDFDFSPSQVKSWEPVKDLISRGELPKSLSARIEFLTTVSGLSPDVVSLDAGRREKEPETTTRTAKLTDSHKVALPN